MKRKLSILCMIFIMALGLPMAANAQETPTVTFDGSEEIKYNYSDTTNFGDGFANMMPGEERSQDIILKNTSDRSVDFYMTTETLRTFEEFNQTSGAAYQVKLTVTDKNGTSIIYGGSEDDGSNRIGADDEGLGNLNGNVNEWFRVVTLDGGTEAIITMAVSLDGESHDNSYMAAEGTFQFQFMAGYDDKDYEAAIYKQLEDVIITQFVYGDVVKTGDNSRPLFWAAGIGGCAVLMMVLIIWKKKNKEAKTVLFLAVMTVSLICSPMNARAAQSTGKEYTVTFRPGNIAEFSETVVKEYMEQYGADKVNLSQATGSISVTVPAGSAYPEAPQSEDIILDEEHKGRYYVTTGWRPTDEIVLEDRDYVVDYAALVDAVEYAVRYVDKVSGMDVATPTVSLGNVGDTIRYTAKNVEDFAYDTYLQEMVLEKGKENVLTFYYQSTRTVSYETVEVEGATIYDTVILPGSQVTIVDSGDDTEEDVPDENISGEGSTAEESQNNTENEEGSVSESSEGGSGESEEINSDEQRVDNIEDEDVPLATFLSEEGVRTGLVVGCIAGLCIIVLILLFLIKRNKKEVEQ